MGTRLPLSLMQELVFHYLLFQNHFKDNIFNPFRTNASVMFCVFRIISPDVDISGINCNMI